jgi:threonine aldolase
MRQAGILAAAGIVALTTMVERLAEDHLHARILGEAAANTKVKIDLSTVETNIVLFDVSPLGMKAAEFIDELKGNNIKASEYGKYLVRLVTHKDVSRADIDYAVGVLARQGNRRKASQTHA